MYRTNDKDIWRVFREHHYLSAEMNKAATVYTIYWDNVLIGMFSILNQPSGSYKYAFRVHRIVVLPDYQGLGMGTKILDYFGNMHINNGHKFFLRTTHMRFGRHCRNSLTWIEGGSSCKISNAGGVTHEKKYKNYDRKRKPYSFEYMGQDCATKPHIEIHVDDNPNINYDIMKADLEWLKERYWLCVITGEINTPSKIEDICLELGIRTQLLYTTKKGVATIGSKYKKKKIVTTWDEAFSEKVRNYYK